MGEYTGPAMVEVVPVPDHELGLAETLDAEPEDAGAESVTLPAEGAGAEKADGKAQDSAAAIERRPTDDKGVALHELVAKDLGTRTTMESIVWYIQTYSLPLILGVVAGMTMANLDEQSYDDLRHIEIIPAETFAVFGHALNIHFVINDIFMTFFFGIAAKEITEACLPGGSLNPSRKAANPLLATVGGAVGPVAMYFLSASLLYDADVFGAPSRDDFCAPAIAAAGAGDAHRRLEAAQSAAADGPCTLGERWEAALGDAGCVSVTELCVNGTEVIAAPDYTWAMIANGWGIPTATDISLAWVVATVIFGVGHPAISFLLLLAVADDGLGLIIIAIFYPSPGHPFHGEWLLMVVIGMCTAYVLRINHVMRWWIYIGVAGSMCWVGLLGAALHPALAFVFVVPFLPALHGDEKEDGAHAGAGVSVVQEEPADLAADLVDQNDALYNIRESMMSKSASAKVRAEVRRVFDSLCVNDNDVLHVEEMEAYIRSLSAETIENESVEILIANFHADMHTYMDFNNSIHNRQTGAPNARRDRIDDQDVVTFEEFYKWFEHTGGYHIQMVQRDLDHVPLFSQMNSVDKEVLAKAISFASVRGHNGRLHVYKAGEEIVTQGDEGHEMFIVHTGACVAIDNNGEVVQRYSAVMHPTTHEHTFGEVALLSSIKNKGAQGARRTCTITATEDTTVWTLGDHELRIAGRQVFNQVTAMAQAYHDVKDDEVYHDHAPLHMYEHQTKFAVDIGMFFFAWANAGVKVTGAGGMTLVVLASLLFGKVFGIVLMVRQ